MLVARALQAEGARYILVGGLAMGFHGLVRATQDIDLFVSSELENIEKVKRALSTVYQDPAIDEIELTDLETYNVIRYGPPDKDYLVDLIGRLGQAFSFEDLAAEDKIMDGVTVHVATPATLYAMKKDTVRPKDHADAYALQEKFQLGEH